MCRKIDRIIKVLSVVLATVLFIATPIEAVEVTDASENTSSASYVAFENTVTKGPLTLMLNRETYEICLKDHDSGAVWYSNPQDRENETVAVGVNKMNINSAIVVNYRDVEKKISDSVNSYTGAVVDNNVKFEENENGFTVYYKFNGIRAIIPLKYELTEDALKCTVVSDKIIESDEYPLLSISLLPYFGAGGSKDEGYLLIPDGSGALIDFNNGKAAMGSYSQKVYGRDEVVQLSSKAAYNQSVKLPVFGIRNNGYGVLGVIENGEALATVNATSGGKLSSYNAVNASFTLRTVDTYALGESSGGTTTDITIIENKTIKEGDLTVTFYPLNKEKSDYSGMAEKYKECLMKEYNLSVKEDKATVNLEVMGAVKVKKYLFGIPYMKTVVLTDLNAVKETTGKLNSMGVENINVLYTGWNKDTLNNTPLDKANVLSALGGNSGVKKIIKEWKDTSNQLYLYADFYKVKDFPGFASRNNSSIKNISEEPVVCYDYSFLSYFKEFTSPVSYIISMGKVGKYVKKFTNSLNKLPNGVNIGIGEIADKVSSDFTESGWNRQDSAENYSNIIKGFSESRNVIVQGGNKYALIGADSIINMPSNSSEFSYADDSVPFYQLAVSGLIEYSYKPINLSSDTDYEFLKAVETGADLHFFLTDKNQESLNKAGYTSLYSVDANDWLDKISEYSKKIQEISAATEGSALVSHEKLGEEVYKSIFANGCEVIVNYNNEPFVVDEIEVKAMSYAIIKGGVN